MSYFRVNHSKYYTVMSNYHLKDKNLSLKAVGLLSKMLSLPDEWDYSVNGLVAICKENKTAVQNALKELEECGYLKRTKTQDASGRFDWIYDIYEKPFKEKPCTENPVMENPCTENVPQLNTNKSNTKKLNTKELNTKGIYEQIKDLFNETCVSFPKVTTLSEKRKKSIHARLNTYSFDDFKRCFEMAEQSDFLKGKNNRDWQPNFDWIIKDSNMAKILDGNYSRNYSSRKPNNQSKQPKEYEMHYPEIFDFQTENGWDEEGYNKAVREYNEWLESSK